MQINANQGRSTQQRVMGQARPHAPRLGLAAKEGPGEGSSGKERTCRNGRCPGVRNEGCEPQQFIETGKGKEPHRKGTAAALEPKMRTLNRSSA
jgi:hypothetical protein